jgi:small subunit ribosomal protein S7
MPRKGYIAKREVAPDPVYQSTLVTKFVNSMMWGGKKSTAQGIFYTAMTNLEQKGGDEALKLFKKAVENCKPLLEVKSRRVGGANYQVPIEVLPERRTSLAIRWLVTYGRARGGDEEEGRRSSYGRSEQGVCALSLVVGNVRTRASRTKDETLERHVRLTQAWPAE